MDLENRTELPNSLEEHWMPFTSNRDYKESPRLMVPGYYTGAWLRQGKSNSDLQFPVAFLGNMTHYTIYKGRLAGLLNASRRQ